MGDLLMVALLQQVPRCPAWSPAIDTLGARPPASPSPATMPDSRRNRRDRWYRRYPSDSQRVCHHEDIEPFGSAPPRCRSGPEMMKRLRPRHTRLDGRGRNARPSSLRRDLHT